ncbi:MAG: hypothetical protein K0Q50_2750 [Vampirovibrio sp.]|jgi:hypothetical protein|nr:hypothetical protein [Vampirovibrio sp.]
MSLRTFPLTTQSSLPYSTPLAITGFQSPVKTQPAKNGHPNPTTHLPVDSITLRFASKQKSGPVHFGGLKQQLTDISQSISRKFTDKGVLLMQAALDGDTARVIKYLENNKRLYIKDHRGNSLRQCGNCRLPDEPVSFH